MDLNVEHKIIQCLIIPRAKSFIRGKTDKFVLIKMKKLLLHKRLHWRIKTQYNGREKIFAYHIS